jgi:hypothetical protein
MKKNVSGQSIGAQMITASDGSNFTGSVSVLVTVDNGTQTAGGGTAPTHEGNGYHSYTPTQSETNGDHIAFTFTGTGAITATIQTFTNFPQSVDNATNISAIKTKTDFLPSATAGAAGGVFIAGTNAATTVTTSFTTTFTGNLTGSVNSVTSGVTVTTNNDKSGYSISGTITTLDGLNNFDPATDTVANVTTVATLTGHTPQTGDSFARIGINGAGLTNINLPNQTMDIVGDITGNLSGSVGSVTAPVTVGTNNDKTDYSLSTAGIKAIWDQLTSALTTVGSIGKLIVDNIDAAISSRASASALATAQADLDIITGADGATLATLQPNQDYGTITKNAAFPNFEFLMVLASDHVTPGIGLTVSGQRSVDGAAFTSVAGGITEVSNGIYQFDALAADTNGDVITWRFSAATADDTFVTFKTTE